MVSLKSIRLLLYALVGGALFALSLNAAVAAGNGISSPKNGERVYGTIAVKGIADAPDFLRWNLDALLFGDTQAVAPIARGQKRMPREDILTRLDTTTLPDGMHQLRLRVIRISGQYEEFFVSILVNNTDIPTPTVRAVRPTVPRPTRETKPTPTALNQIVAPPDGAIVHGVIFITGAVDSPTFLSWKLDLLFDRREEKAFTIAAGRMRNVTADVLTQLDTTLLPDGTHLLRLRVSNNDDTFTETTSTLTIANPKPKKVRLISVCTVNPAESLPFPARVLLSDWLQQHYDNLKKFCSV